MTKRRHGRNSLTDQIAIDGRRRAEGGHAITIDDPHQLFRVKIVEIINHHRAPHQPLAVELSPGSFRPTGFGNGEVQTAVCCLLPVLRGNDVRERIGKVVDHAFWFSGGSRCEIQQHRILNARFCPREHFALRAFLVHGFAHIIEALHVLPHRPKLCRKAGSCERFSDFARDIILRGADDAAHARTFHTVSEIGNRQHVCSRDHHSAELMQRDRREPVFIMSFQHHHDAVAPLNPRFLEYMRHPVAESSDILEGKDMFFPFRITPDKRFFLRCSCRDNIDHIIAEIKISRILQLQFF